jgi:hypothetical protein
LAVGQAFESSVGVMPTRFYGSVEIDMVSPVRSLDAILSTVVRELQRT